MERSLDTISECWSRMNLNERSFTWIVLIGSPLFILTFQSSFPFLFVAYSAHVVAAAADPKRPRYDPDLHLRAFLLWAMVALAILVVLALWELSRASGPLDYFLPAVYTVIAGWLIGMFVLRSINPRFDYRFRVLRFFDPGIPGTRKFEAKQAASQFPGPA